MGILLLFLETQYSTEHIAMAMIIEKRISLWCTVFDSDSWREVYVWPCLLLCCTRSKDSEEGKEELEKKHAYWSRTDRAAKSGPWDYVKHGTIANTVGGSY